MVACKYCGLGNTHKDEFGFCKKYGCYTVSGIKDKVEELEKKRRDAQCFMSTYKINQFDGTPYNPQEDEVNWINKQIAEVLL